MVHLGASDMLGRVSKVYSVNDYFNSFLLHWTYQSRLHIDLLRAQLQVLQGAWQCQWTLMDAMQVLNCSSIVHKLVFW